MEVNEPANVWVLNTDGEMVQETIQYSPGLLKIFDEVFTNAIDHSLREKTVKNIQVDINQETNTFIVYNDGPGIEVEIHKGSGMYVPQFIFSEVYSSSNYDDEQVREWAGQNGVGSKISNFFSDTFQVETLDS